VGGGDEGGVTGVINGKWVG